MSQLIRKREIVADDFTTLADDAPIPTSGRIIVSLARWQQEQSALTASGLVIGVRIPNTAEVPPLWPLLKDRSLIVLEFPTFPDGRAYSQAGILRDRFKYTGELRATGAAVVRDQLAFMERCGIDAFELRDDQDPQLCLSAFKDFSLPYQGAADHAQPIYRRRAAG